MIRFPLPAPAPRPLPVFATIQRAYQLLWEHRWLELRLMAAPFLMLTLAMALQTRAFGDALTVEQLQVTMQQLNPLLLLSWSASMLLGGALLIALSVSWRRFLLLKEPPTAFYFHKPFWRYLALSTAFYIGLILLLIVATVVSSIVLYAGGLKDHPLAFRLLLTLLLIGSLVAAVGWIVRHILLFTAVTVDNRGLSWPDAAQAMQGNVIRYCLAWLGTIGPIMIAGFALASALASAGLDPQTTLGAILFSAVQALLSVCQLGLGASLGALIYDFLLRGGGPVDR